MEKEMQTERLILRPSSQERDGETFFNMLLKAGNEDFRLYTGADCHGSFLANFLYYFDCCGKNCFSLFLKDEPDQFIGYAAFHSAGSFLDSGDGYEVDFYLAKEYRNLGLTTEAMKRLMEAFFDGEIVQNCNADTPLWAKALSRNKASVRVLEKLGFRKINEEKAALISNFVDWDDESSCEELISEFRYAPLVCANEMTGYEADAINATLDFA